MTRPRLVGDFRRALVVITGVLLLPGCGSTAIFGDVPNSTPTTTEGASEPDSGAADGGNAQGNLCTPARFVQIDAGARHACALTADGCTTCWGDNSPGPSGGPGGQARAPTVRFSQVLAGEYETCGLTLQGHITCWGTVFEEPPQDVALAISMSQDQKLCALNAAHAMECRFGDGEAPRREGPFTQIATASYFACGLGKDGSVDCLGELVGEPTPTGKFVQIAADDFQACGIDETGGVQCWGSGELHSSPPKGHFTQLAIAAGNACVLDEAGQLTCWGDDAATLNEHPAGTFTAITLGGRSGYAAAFACALRDDGSVACWGANNHGQATPPM